MRAHECASEFLAALERLDAGAQEVLEDEQHDGEQADRADADLAVAERHAGREQARWRTPRAAR